GVPGRLPAQLLRDQPQQFPFRETVQSTWCEGKDDAKPTGALGGNQRCLLALRLSRRVLGGLGGRVARRSGVPNFPENPARVLHDSRHRAANPPPVTAEMNCGCASAVLPRSALAVVMSFCLARDLPNRMRRQRTPTPSPATRRRSAMTSFRSKVAPPPPR